MSSWVCKNCGTINKDILDTPPTGPSPKMELIEEEIKRRHEIQSKGERVKFFCFRCNEERI